MNLILTAKRLGDRALLILAYPIIPLSALFHGYCNRLHEWNSAWVKLWREA
ncbi:hypothetical protein [Metapseudomonas otitidis]|uniref:hypothetical protein n=1 Tax=Metapseudomonas otitidis TaxID=319939 RepID=UPI002448D189|nr:hypothetical protein [Pseudomonas otitidis]MDG9784948.1 hypothetical protein [Pseudomonas otitidis]